MRRRLVQGGMAVAAGEASLGRLLVRQGQGAKLLRHRRIVGGRFPGRRGASQLLPAVGAHRHSGLVEGFAVLADFTHRLESTGLMVLFLAKGRAAPLALQGGVFVFLAARRTGDHGWARIRAGPRNGQSADNRGRICPWLTASNTVSDVCWRTCDRVRFRLPPLMIRLNDILEKVNAYHADADLDLIKKAYVYSAKVHQGQIRKSGEPYLIHPLEVAGLLADLKLDEASIVAGLLHDTIEDTLAQPAEIKELFGAEVLDLVEGVTKLGTFQSSQAVSVEEKQAENFRKMLVAMAKDIRVILVKLADRTHNMRTLEHMKPESQQRIAQETLDIYAPLANRLGIQWIKIELEDLAFRYLKSVEYGEVEAQLEQSHKDRERFIAEVLEWLGTKLKEAGLEAQVGGRPKHVYTIWKNMRKTALSSVTQLPAIVASRLIPKTVPACYEALGLIHSLWKPVPGRFKDYIAIPKPNMYQSLHTTVIGPTGERIEIQMRTEEMHRIAEEGIAAHWVYKEGKSSGRGGDDEKFAWLRQLMEWQQDLKDPREFLETVKVDLFTDEVFVFTPKGDVRSLPQGSCPIDFAYAIHSEVGAHCAGAKVNGKM